MEPTATGRISATKGGGYDLILERRFHAPAVDIWASIVEPERTARWFGAWRGDGAPGKTVKIQLGFEENTPWCDLRIDACSAPHQLAVSMVDPSGEWHMEVRLTESDGWTELQLIQHLDDPELAKDTGPGWEYYLDMLIASRDDLPLPDFADYYPRQSDHFVEQARLARLAAAEH